MPGKHPVWVRLSIFLFCMANIAISEASVLTISARILPATCDIRLDNPQSDGVMHWKRELFSVAQSHSLIQPQRVKVSFSGCARRNAITEAMQLQLVNAGAQDVRLTRQSLWGARHESGVAMEVYAVAPDGHKERLAPGASSVRVMDFQPRSLLSGKNSSPAPSLGITVLPRRYDGALSGDVKTIFFLSAVYG